MTTMAHQRKIGDSLRELQPRERIASLDGYAVETIGHLDAVRLIVTYEWLRNIRGQHFIGLVSPTRELHGVACFGFGPSGKIRDIIGAPALCLERGACVHYAPANAASFLITRACRLLYRIKQVSVFFAYADPMAGEYGGIYQAANWLYLGQGIDRYKNRQERFFVLPPGGDPNDHSQWRTTRSLRRKVRLNFEQAKAEGWQIGLRGAKHVYAIHVGSSRDRRKWKAGIQNRIQPYPAPRPELKRKTAAKPETVFRVTSPLSSQPNLFA